MCVIKKQWVFTLLVSVLIPLFAIAETNPFTSFRGKCVRGDCFNGEGVMEFPNGDEYHGSFKNGEASGDGVMKFANGNNYYGHWEHNMRDGKGRFTYAIGHEYLGFFRQNHMHGKGRMSFANGDWYEGEWKLSKPDGYGIYSFHTGERYEGGFKAGLFHGFGTFYYKSGARYSGNWMNHKKHGKGTLVDADGHKTEGEWIFGKAVGGASQLDEPVDVVEVPGVDEQVKNVPADENGDVKIWAVIVGIADYTHMPALHYTDDDAYKYYSFLKSPEGGAVPDRQIKLLIDDMATRDAIIDALYTTYVRADENDVVVFYYSGHGLNGALVPYDYDGINNRLYHDELKQAFEACKARHKLLIADACYAGSLLSYNSMGDALAARGDAIQDMLRKFYRDFENAAPGMAVILSSNSDDLSYEDNGIRSGVFSHFLMRGLAGEADANYDGLVVLSELASFVINRVSRYTVGAQTPLLMGDADDNMPVAVVRR
ncbi:MAG: hypothetical protein CMN32_02565 [Saprospirales bacterium]|nr:hypothetical protein [Saprospirales bacterium]